ncbi:MAG: ABC transporter permease, partial [Deltaproteobacteria bacterium]|nr:ABC transporter permease [Deltaproteobacteria bacterium]
MYIKLLTVKRLAFLNLIKKPWRSFSLATLAAVFSAVLFGGGLIVAQLQKGLESLSERLGADLLIVPYGYEPLAKEALLKGTPETYYMSAKVFDKVKNFPGVIAATPQFFLASLNSECCAERVQIIAYDQNSDFIVKPWLKAKVNELKPGQIVIGSKILAERGQDLFFFGQIHKVAAKMEPTGIGLDSSVFIPLEAVYGLIKQIPSLTEKIT